MLLDDPERIPGQLTHLFRGPSGLLAELHTGCPQRMERSGANPCFLAKGVEPVERLPVLE